MNNVIFIQFEKKKSVYLQRSVDQQLSAQQHRKHFGMKSLSTLRVFFFLAQYWIIVSDLSWTIRTQTFYIQESFLKPLCYCYAYRVKFTQLQLQLFCRSLAEIVLRQRDRKRGGKGVAARGGGRLGGTEMMEGVWMSDP